MYSFLGQDEYVIFKDKANKKQFLYCVKGGELILTNTRLVFLAHSFNLGSKFDEILLSEIALTRNTIDIFICSGNLIKIITKIGKQHTFVVTSKHKELWKSHIVNAVENFRGVNF